MAPRIITTAAGPVEVEVQGSGLPILILHGSPGGIDASIAMSRFLLHDDKFQAICLSRPGYLGTPLDPQRKSIDAEADLLAAVLDALEIRRVGVLAWSGGGPSALRMAVRHPDRVSNVVAVAAVSALEVISKPSLMERFLFGTALGERLVAYMVKKAPSHIIEEALAGEGTLSPEEVRKLTKQVLEHPDQTRLILEIAPTISTAGKRQVGWQNDLGNFGRIESLELEKVRCPVLLVHGDGDTDVPFEHSRAAHERLADSTLVAMKSGTHLSFYAHPEAPDVQNQTQEWFLKYGSSVE